jgi:hypothetical protein
MNPPAPCPNREASFWQIDDGVQSKLPNSGPEWMQPADGHDKHECVDAFPQAQQRDQQRGGEQPEASTLLSAALAFASRWAMRSKEPTREKRIRRHAGCQEYG